jgi:hypothetical protein
VQGINVTAFIDELIKIGASTTEGRSPASTWTAKSVEAPRSKMPSIEAPKPPATPGDMGPKLVRPAAQFGPRQNQQDDQGAPDSNPALNADLRMQQPPNVVFGVR